jgi:hypothetical protein
MIELMKSGEMDSWMALSKAEFQVLSLLDLMERQLLS